MDHDFWAERWALGEIGFHRSTPHWALDRHWASVAAPTDAPILVPLCGKSLDLHWLRARHRPIVGVELDPRAVSAFFHEWPAVSRDHLEVSTLPTGLIRYAHQGIEIHQGDFFAFEPGPYGAFDHVYDRAALIALPFDLRQRYLDQLISLLAPGANGLLITFEYEQIQMDGPPFSVLHEEIVGFHGLDFERLEVRDVLEHHPGMRAKGLTALTECVYLVSKP